MNNETIKDGRLGTVSPVSRNTEDTFAGSVKSIQPLCDGSFKVSSTSNPSAVAGAIAGSIRTQKSNREKAKIEIRVIGAGSLNQATKAVIIARGFLAPMGIDIIIIPSFEDLYQEGSEITSVKLTIVER